MTKNQNATGVVSGTGVDPVLAIDREIHARMLYYMMLTRELEERIERKLYRQGKIVGGVYVSRGQEALSVGSCILTRPSDVICPSHRDMGAVLIRGMTPARILAQYMGRRDGYTGGRDGNMHMGDLSLGIVSFISMLADQVPVAAGIALSLKLRKNNDVVLCYFGEGATSRGDWHEGLNFAAVQKLPVVFICNNNQYAYSTPVEKQMAIENVADRALAYGIPGEIVDGNEILSVYDATRRAIERARGSLGPTLLECKTFRMTGHSAHDGAHYVPKELFDDWSARDPIPRYQRLLVQEGIVSSKDVRQQESAIADEVDRALQWAEQSPYPDPEEGLKGVYNDK